VDGAVPGGEVEVTQGRPEKPACFVVLNQVCESGSVALRTARSAQLLFGAAVTPAPRLRMWQAVVSWRHRELPPLDGRGSGRACGHRSRAG